jgi:RNA polymerase sigma-70 factor (ECF subfamily)
VSVEQSYEEKELLSLVSQGDKQAFGTFFKMKSTLVHYWIKRMVKEETDTLEILQDVFIEIWLYRDKLDTVNYLVPWLKKITSRHCFKYLERIKKKRSLSAGELQPEQVALLSDKAPDTHLRYKEMQYLVQQALATLTIQQQEIYRLSREEGMNSEQIAAMLNVSRGHVRNVLSSILGVIRTHLGESGKLYFIGWLLLMEQIRL